MSDWEWILQYVLLKALKLTGKHGQAATVRLPLCMKESLLKWKAGKAQEAMFKKLHAEMKLEYPLGTNFSFSVSSVKERK